MKKNMIKAMIVCLLLAPAVSAVASETTSGNDNTEMPSRKPKKKTSAKKSTAKKTATKPAVTTATPKAEEITTEETAAETSNSGSSNVLGSLLGGILGSSSQSGKGSSVTSALTTIFDAAKGAKKDDLVGTWSYTEPAVVFSSKNVLKNIGGEVASSAIEKQLQTQFEKLGIKKGTMKMTFDADGNFTQTIGGHAVKGTYTVKNHNVTLKYAGQVQQFIGTTQIDGNDLLIVMDASKLLKYGKTIGALTGNSLLKTASNLVSSMDGMQVGLKLDKQ